MRQQLRNNGNEKYPFRNQSLRRVYLLIHTVNDAVNTAPSTTDIDLSKIRIDMTLSQNGKSLSTSFNAIAPVVRGALFDKSSGSVSDIGFASGGTTCSGIKVLTETASVKAESYVIVPLIHTGINLKGDDLLDIQIQLNQGHFSTAVDSDSKIYLISEVGTDIVQMDMELPQYIPLTADKQQVKFDFPACSEIALLDSGTSAEKSANAITSIEVKSRHFSETYDALQVIANNQMDLVGTPTERFNNFIIANVNPSALIDTHINLSIDTSLITTNNQYLYVNEVAFNTQLVKRGWDLSRKISMRKGIARGLRNL